MYLPNTEYQNKLLFGMSFSLVMHVFFAYYFIHNYEKPPAPITELKIEEVQFMSKEEVIQRRQEQKRKPEKEAKKEIEAPVAPLQPKPEEKPKLEEKKLPTLEEKKIDIKIEAKTFEQKKIELETPKAKQLEIKNLDQAPQLVEKNRTALSADEVKKLININEVGERKISDKTLEVVNQLQREVKARNIAEIAGGGGGLQQRKVNLANLDQKIATMDDAKRMNISSKDLDLGDDKRVRRVSGSAFEQGAPLVEEKELNQKTNLRDVKIVSQPKAQVFEEKAVENIKTKEQKEIKEDKKNVIVSEVKSIKKEEPKREFEMMGEIKDRKVLNIVRPEYPEWARKQRIEAIVRVYIEVDKEGNVMEKAVRVEITSGYVDLDRYVMDIVKQWKFVPIDKNEIQIGTLTFKFKLN